MRRNHIRAEIASFFCLSLLLILTGCPPTDVDNDNQNGNENDNDNSDAPALVLTDIDVQVQGRVASGDGIIAYTAANSDGTPFGPDYILLGDTAGRGIANATDFDPDAFAVTGKKIALVGKVSGTRPFGVSILDTDAGTTDDIPLTDIRLKNIPTGNYDPGHIQADGGYVATLNDPTSVTDGYIVKVIDVTGATPVVISFTNNPANNTTTLPSQILVDAETKLVVALRNYIFYVYDINNPTVAPVEFDVTATNGVDDDPQYAIDKGVIIYHDDTSDRVVYTLDVTDGANTPVALTGSGSTGSNAIFAIRDGSYGYFFEGPASQGNAAAVNTLPDLAPVETLGETIAENTANIGRFGYGQTMTTGLLGGVNIWIIAGVDDIGSGDPLQYSSDGATWHLLKDPNSPDDNLGAGDVDANEAGSLVGFKYEISDNTKLGYATTD